MKEVWKNIPGYEGHYQASNLGRIKSLERFDPLGRRVREKILSQNFKDNGYLMVSLSMNGKLISKTVHSLVAMAFLNHAPCAQKLVVDHINNIRHDNRVENLQLISQRENSSKNPRGSCDKYIGVIYKRCQERFVADIRINMKKVRIGTFNTAKEASKAYNEVLDTYNNGGDIHAILKKYIKHPSSPQKGVHFCNKHKKWVVRFTKNKKNIYLGMYKDEKDAIRVAKNYLKHPQYERLPPHLNLRP